MCVLRVVDRRFSQFYCDDSLSFEQAMAEYRDRGLEW
jgi:hypothetical protein